MGSITIELDTVVDAAYIRLATAPVARTVAHDDRINIDLDVHGVVIGIEVLGEGVPLPFAELVDRYHVHSDVVEMLRVIRPDVAAFLQLRFGTDGWTSAQQADRPAAPV